MIQKLKNPTEEELNQLMTIWLTVNKEAHPFINERYWQDNVSVVRKMLPASDLFVKVIDGTIIGFLGLQENYIAGIFVQTNWRNQGVGTQLLNEAKKQHDLLYLTVYEKNQSAYQFYLKHGFTVSAIQKTKQKALEYKMTYKKESGCSS